MLVAAEMVTSTMVEDGNAMVASPAFSSHAIDEVRDRDHIVGLVIVALLFLSRCKKTVIPALKRQIGPDHDQDNR